MFSIYIILKETFKSLSRAKLSVVVSLLMTCISVLLVVISMILVRFSGILEQRIKDKVSLNIFLKESTSDLQAGEIKAHLDGLNFISSARYLNKEQAEKEFLKETGEDFREVLEYNPLPASFVINLRPEYIEPDSLQKISKIFSRIEGVDEVVFQSEEIYKALRSLSVMKMYVFSGAGILLLVSLYIVYSTNKLIIAARQAQIETMKLVGTKLYIIKLPFVLNGVFLGMIASAFAMMLFKTAEWWLGSYLNMGLMFFMKDALINSAILLSGPTIGFLAGIISV
ncbi:MAG: cell division protein FtsX, partial [Ignavibacteriales bacterium]